MEAYTPACYWFRSTRFPIIRDEDLDTHPGIYGRALAHWLRKGLLDAGYPRARLQATPWGWCIVISRHPRCLWVGCGGALLDDGTATGSPCGGALVWHCHAACEKSPWWTFGWRRRASDAALRELDLTLRRLLLEEPEIQQVDPP